MEKLVRVGVMPGRINEVAVEVGTPIAEVIRIAELDTTGYEVKVDGVKVENLEATTVTSSTSLILLAKLVKGNAEKTVRVGVMPGRISEYAVPVGASIAEVIAIAELDTTGYEVKVDGIKVDDLNNTRVTERTSLVLLAKLVKGN